MNILIKFTCMAFKFVKYNKDFEVLLLYDLFDILPWGFPLAILQLEISSFRFN
jgi:hypothetical protein